MKINEFFTSIQGEGAYIGELQFFLRLSGCNIKCDYCDTEHNSNKIFSNIELISLIDQEYEKNFFSRISITGGEPLFQINDLRNLLKSLGGRYKILLETNSTLPENLSEVIEFIDTVSMDYKLDYHLENNIVFENFYNISKNKENYIKIVFSKEKVELLEKALLKLKNIIEEKTVVFLQPETPLKKGSLDLGIEMAKRFDSLNIRVLPQIHPFLNIK